MNEEHLNFWNEYTKKVQQIAWAKLSKCDDAYTSLMANRYIAKSVLFYSSRWPEHQKFGIASPEEFAKGLGY